MFFDDVNVDRFVRNKYKQQCTQAIRQWDQALCERNNFREELSKVEAARTELTKELEQAMSIRVKASRDIKRLTEERNSALHEYSVIMGERDLVHRCDRPDVVVKCENCSCREMAALQEAAARPSQQAELQKANAKVRLKVCCFIRI